MTLTRATYERSLLFGLEISYNRSIELLEIRKIILHNLNEKHKNSLLKLHEKRKTKAPKSVFSDVDIIKEILKQPLTLTEIGALMYIAGRESAAIGRIIP